MADTTIVTLVSSPCPACHGMGPHARTDARFIRYDRDARCPDCQAPARPLLIEGDDGQIRYANLDEIAGWSYALLGADEDQEDELDTESPLLRFELELGRGPLQVEVWSEAFQVTDPRSKSHLEAGPSGGLRVEAGPGVVAVGVINAGKPFTTDWSCSFNGPDQFDRAIAAELERRCAPSTR